MTPHGTPCPESQIVARETVHIMTRNPPISGLKSDYLSRGYLILDKVFTDEALRLFERAVMEVAWKIAEDQKVKLSSWGDVDSLVALERKCPAGFFALCESIGGTVAGLKLAVSPKAIETLNEITDSLYYRVLPTSPVLFWNHPDAPRLQYDWHQESSYFPDMPDGTHMWFPLFQDVLHETGPMLIAKGSHKRKYEYRQVKKTGHVTQLIPHVDMEGFEHIECTVPRGGAVFFDHYTVHCTGKNLTNRPRIAGIVRYIDAMKSPRDQPMMGFTYKHSVEPLVSEAAR